EDFTTEFLRRIAAYRDGSGPDTEAEDLQAAEAFELAADVQAEWTQAKRERLTLLSQRAQAPINRRPLATPAPKPPVPQPAAKPGEVPLRDWSEVAVPKVANERERLTYVPGLVGDITEWIVRGARRPNRMMALGVASVVVGTLIGRRIEGPTKS